MSLQSTLNAAIGSRFCCNIYDINKRSVELGQQVMIKENTGWFSENQILTFRGMYIDSYGATIVQFDAIEVPANDMPNFVRYDYDNSGYASQYENYGYCQQSMNNGYPTQY